MKARPSDSSIPGYSRHADEAREKNWNAFFRDAHLVTMSDAPVTCCVSMVLYHYDEEMVEKAAKRHGFKAYFKSKGNIGYIKNEFRNETQSVNQTQS